MMRKQVAVMMVAAGLCCGAVQAQKPACGMAMKASPKMEMVAPAKALDAMLTAFEHDVVPAAKAMPAEKYGFAPSAATFAPGSPAKFDTVRTFVQQVTHLADANYYFMSQATGMKPDVDMKAINEIKDKDAAVKALEASFVFAHKAVAMITTANAFEGVKPVDGQTTRATIAAFTATHGYDHYGQIVEYLRMNGVVPPSSAK
jgi:hypothetical protein